MKKVALVIFVGLVVSGCSGETWVAQFHMVKAENAHTRAYELRIKKVHYEERLKLYRKACEEFVKAYEFNRETFTLSRIELAIESCMRVEDRKNEERFQAFAESYVRQHPTETEYGDAFPALPME